MNYLNIFGWIVIVISAGMALFQFILAAGAPLGNLAWGGKFKKLPSKLRLSSLVSAFLFIVLIFTVLERIETLKVFNSPQIVSVIIWIFTGIFMLSTVGNLASKSRIEKMIMTAIAIILVISLLVLSLS